MHKFPIMKILLILICVPKFLWNIILLLVFVQSLRKILYLRQAEWYGSQAHIPQQKEGCGCLVGVLLSCK